MRALLTIASALRPLAQEPGVVEAVLYGSLVRGDYQPGCSDIDIFLVTTGPSAPAHLARSLALTGALAAGLKPRDIDVAWCTLDEVLRHKCTYKFLTIYREDYEKHSVLLGGRPLHRLQPPAWSPKDRSRHLLSLLERSGVQWGIVAGETVKLWLWLQGYRGPWDKWSVREAVSRLDRSGCPSRIWGSYLSCAEPPVDCIAWVRAFLGGCAGGYDSRPDI